MSAARSRWAWTLTALAVGVCTCQSGCVRRRMTIRTNPPGAQVYVDDYPIGTTPISANFTYYGQRKIRLVMDGYETLTVMQPIPAPWYQWPPLDFVAENLVPGEIQDGRSFSYQLTPQMVVPHEQLLSRAEGLRREVLAAGAMAPLAPRPVPSGPGLFPAPASPELIPTPPAIGGQPVHPLPPGGR